MPSVPSVLLRAAFATPLIARVGARVAARLFLALLPSLPIALSVAVPAVAPRTVRAQAPEPAIPTFAELEAQGARIGRIVIVNQNIFDPEDPEEDTLLFRWANALHIRTRPEVIERALLFRTGDPLTVRLIEETERLLRGMRFLYDVSLRPVAYRDGVVDIEVATRDTWTLSPGFSASRSGGTNTTSGAIQEVNLLGTGIAMSIGGFSNVDRSGVSFQFSNDRALDGRTSIGVGLVENSDGRRRSARLVRPFYALDTRWAAGVTVDDDDRIEAVYNGGEKVSEYRYRQTVAEAFAGWSTGEVDGWVRRYSVGFALRERSYAVEPGLVPPPAFPPDETLTGPFVRFELIEDRFEKARNLDQIDRPEFLALGFASTLQLGRASTAFGSSSDAWVYSASISRGFEPTPSRRLLASANLTGRYAEGGVSRQRAGGRAQYYHPHASRWAFYASASADVLTNPAPLDALLLGGDNGLRGYPLRYQSGTYRALLTLEERLYTDQYWFRLFRVGAAVFFDTGRAWGGDNVNTVNPGWLSNVGFGLRVFSMRAAFGNVLHLDVAFPLDADPSMKRVQFLVSSRASF
jgi:hypothetical protein